MTNNKWTSIHFDYGGYYFSGSEWISRGDHKYSLLITKPFEETTLAKLVGRICRKIGLDETTTVLKLSYPRMAADAKVKTYLKDDEDVLVYILGCKDNTVGVLNVELMDDMEQGQTPEKHLREDEASRVDVRIEDMSDARVDNDMIGLNTEAEPQLLLENDACIEEAELEDTYDLCDVVDVGSNVEESGDVSHEWDDGINMIVGQEFESKKAVQDLIQRAIHVNYFAAKTERSTTRLYVLRCADAGCKWRLRVAKLKNSDCFSVRTYNKTHTCSRMNMRAIESRRRGTPRMVASVLHDDYPGQFDTPTPKSIVGLIQGRLGVKVSYSTAWRGRRQAATDICGSPEESFMRLPSYLHMLKKMNEGTITDIKCDSEGRFQYLYITLGACIEGFSAMRKVIIMDGTHIKSEHGGVLLFAIAQDPDHHHYPIAFGVVDGEKNLSWRWFLQHLKISIPDSPDLVFVTDRHQSIIKVVEEVYPQAVHGYCVYHMMRNVRVNAPKGKGDECAHKFKECARVYTEAEFLARYASFKNKYPTVINYIEDSSYPNKWARCYFPGERYNIDTTNCVESMNGIFRKAREYALIPMVDAIVGKIIEWFNKYRKMSRNVPTTQKLVPLVEGELHIRCQEAAFMRVNELNSYEGEYCVSARDGIRYLVNLQLRSCSCRHFDIDRYPCAHAIAAARMDAKTGNEDNLHELCSYYYSVEQWALAYYRTIYPVPSFVDWDVPQDVLNVRVYPPLIPHKGPGRRQITRFPSVGEARRKPRSSCNSSSYPEN